jgi:hypothetical protein
MIGSERSTRILPGLSQALSWLREGLPLAQRSEFKLVPIAIPARPSRHRPTAARHGARSIPSRYHQD